MTDSASITKINKWKAAGQRIVFTNGCFDILHKGHLIYLEQAALLGDRLIIGLNSDDSVRRLKGDARPVHDLDFRSHLLTALRLVDLVITFEEDTPQLLIEQIKPDYLVKGGDYGRSEIVGADFVESYGGVVSIIPLVEGYSSSQIIRNIKRI